VARAVAIVTTANKIRYLTEKAEKIVWAARVSVVQHVLAKFPQAAILVKDPLQLAAQLHNLFQPITKIIIITFGIMATGGDGDFQIIFTVGAH
jgi:hypothetical protein